MKEDAHLVCLCPIHHFFFDHPRNNDLPDEGIADWQFIGLVAQRIIEEESRLSSQQNVVNTVVNKEEHHELRVS